MEGFSATIIMHSLTQKWVRVLSHLDARLGRSGSEACYLSAGVTYVDRWHCRRIPEGQGLTELNGEYMEGILLFCYLGNAGWFPSCRNTTPVILQIISAACLIGIRGNQMFQFLRVAYGSRIYLTLASKPPRNYSNGSISWR